MLFLDLLLTCMLFVCIGKIYQTLKTEFHDVYRLRKVSQILSKILSYMSPTLFSLFGYPDETLSIELSMPYYLTLCSQIMALKGKKPTNFNDQVLLMNKF